MDVLTFIKSMESLINLETLSPGFYGRISAACLLTLVRDKTPTPVLFPFSSVSITFPFLFYCCLGGNPRLRKGLPCLEQDAFKFNYVSRRWCNRVWRRFSRLNFDGMKISKYRWARTCGLKVKTTRNQGQRTEWTSSKAPLQFCPDKCVCVCVCLYVVE